MGYEAAPNYDDGAYDGLVVHCSDGRFSRQFNDFVVNHLGILRCDRVVIPGGPGALTARDTSDPGAVQALDDITFLCAGHEIDRVALIQHEACAYYLTRLGATEETLREMQVEDLRHAIEVVRVATGVERVEGYLARLVGPVVVFDAFGG